MRLQKEHRLFVIHQIAQCKTFKQTREAFHNEYGRQLWDSQITMVKKSHEEDILEARRQWNASIIDLGIYNIRRQMELLQATAERGLEWYFEGDAIVYVENEAFDPEKPISRKNPPYIERKVPKYKCHPEWTIRAVELAAELAQGKTIKHRIYAGNGNGPPKFELTLRREKPAPTPPSAPATKGSAKPR